MSYLAENSAGWEWKGQAGDFHRLTCFL